MRTKHQRHILFGLSIIMICLFFAGCGNKSPYNISKEALSTGQKALEITDQYINGDLDYAEAHDKLGGLKDKMKELKKENDDNDDYMVETGIVSIYATMSTYNLSKNTWQRSSSYEDFIGARNSLAETIGEDTL